MIPSEVSDIADLIFPHWQEAEESVQRDILASAWKIHNAEKARAEKAEQEQLALRASMNAEIDRLDAAVKALVEDKS